MIDNNSLLFCSSKSNKRFVVVLINWEDAKRKQIDMKWKIIFEDNPSYLEISLEMEIEKWIAVKAIFVSPVNTVHTLQVKFSLTKERNKAYMLT